MYKMSSTWIDDRAAFVQMIVDGNDRGDSRLPENGMNDRWTATW